MACDVYDGEGGVVRSACGLFGMIRVVLRPTYRCNYAVLLFSLLEHVRGDSEDGLGLLWIW